MKDFGLNARIMQIANNLRLFDPPLSQEYAHSTEAEKLIEHCLRSAWIRGAKDVLEAVLARDFDPAADPKWVKLKDIAAQQIVLLLQKYETFALPPAMFQIVGKCDDQDLLLKSKLVAVAELGVPRRFFQLSLQQMVEVSLRMARMRGFKDALQLTDKTFTCWHEDVGISTYLKVIKDAGNSWKGYEAGNWHYPPEVEEEATK